MGEQLSRLNQEEHSKSYLPIILHLVANYYVSVVMVTIKALSAVKSFIFIIFFVSIHMNPPVPELYNSL